MPHQIPLTALLQTGITMNSSHRITSTSYVHPIAYRNPTTHQHQPVVCQTPWLWLPMVPRYVSRHHKRYHFFHLTFQNVDTQPEQRELLRFLRGIQRALYPWVMQRQHQHIHPIAKLRWVDVLEEGGVDTAVNGLGGSGTVLSTPSVVRWKISTSLTSRIHCYDTTATRVPLESFVEPRGFVPKYVRMMVQFTHVWVNEQSGTAGLGLHILQLQQEHVEPFCRFAFANGSTSHTHVVHTAEVGVQTDVTGDVIVGGPPVASSNSSTTDTASPARTNHPIYGKYFKMCAKGVPRPAVQQKMRMNGVDPGILDTPEGEPLPDGGPPSTGDDDQLTLSLQDTQQLRKTEINATRPNTGSGEAGHGFSLNEIVNGLQSLRKTIFGGGTSSRDRTTRHPARDPASHSDIAASSASNSSTALTATPAVSTSSSLLQLLSAKYRV